jgi:hypothetical protein
MSETTTKSETELNADSAAQKSQTSNGETGAAAKDAQANADEFNAESLEISFGLPPGSLKDVKDEASAYEAVRTMTDKILAAGVGFAPTTDDADANATKTTTTMVAEKKPAAESKTAANPELDALRAEMAEVKGMLTRQTQQTQQQMANDLKRRMTDKMDSWASPKYGVKGNRNYKQTQAAKEFEDKLLPNLLAGYQAAGLPIDQTIETYMERLRVFDDENYKPTKKGADKSAALGTPGSTKSVGGDKSPRSIHHALMANPS